MTNTHTGDKTMSSNMYKTLVNAYLSKARVGAVVSLKDSGEKRVRIGTIDRMIHHVNTPIEEAYVTFALQDGKFRTARLSQITSIGYLPQ
jgi:hypothetical protein